LYIDSRISKTLIPDPSFADVLNVPSLRISAKEGSGIKVLEILESMYNQSLADIENLMDLNLVWREPTSKRGREDDEEPPLMKPKAAKVACRGSTR